MKTSDSSIQLTIPQAAKLWEHLSPNMTAKIHQWMMREIFRPEHYNPPRTRRPCLLSLSDLVTAAILHWLFSVGVRFSFFGQDISKGASTMDFDYPEMPIEEYRAFLKTVVPQRGRQIQLFLEAVDFDCVIHTFPFRGQAHEVTFEDDEMKMVPVPSPTMHIITFLRTATLLQHLSERPPDQWGLPHTFLYVRAIQKEAQERLNKV